LHATARHFALDAYDRQSHIHALHYARIYLFISALHPGHPKTSGGDGRRDDLAPESRELTQLAQESAITCLDICLRSKAFRGSLGYATPSQYLEICFSALFLVKTAALLSPKARTRESVLADVEELVGLLGDSQAARRYSITIRCVNQRVLSLLIYSLTNWI
jgi:hypothetical protein